MTSRDYSKEIGNRSVAPRVPLPIAITLLAIGGVALWFGVAKVQGIPSAKASVAETMPAVVGKPVPQAHGAQR